MRSLGFDYIHFTVKGLDEAARFYERLEFTLDRNLDGGDESVQMSLPSGVTLDPHLACAQLAVSIVMSLMMLSLVTVVLSGVLFTNAYMTFRVRRNPQHDCEVGADSEHYAQLPPEGRLYPSLPAGESHGRRRAYRRHQPHRALRIRTPLPPSILTSLVGMIILVVGIK